MTILLWGITLFFVAFFFQIIIWKIHIPERQTQALVILFFCILAIGLFFLAIISHLYRISNLPVPRAYSDYLHIALFFTSLTLAYMITYSAIEVESPSLLMILKISDMGTQGLDRKDLEETMNDELLIIPRVRDLLTDRMAYLEGEQYKLTRKGKVAAKIFIFYRKILNAGKGG